MARVRLALVAVGALLACTAEPTNALSLFMRTTWLAEVPEEQWRAWFELVKLGRREGKASPYYVEEVSTSSSATHSQRVLLASAHVHHAHVRTT